MKCKSKRCNSEALKGSDYCKAHLCNKTKKDGTKCKNKKFKRKNYCFTHAKYIGNKIGLLGIVIGVLAIIITIFLAMRDLYICPKLHYLCFGNLEVDFKEDPEDVYYIEEKPYVRIEVLNELGYPLLNIKGNVTITCKNKAYQKISKIFKLQERGGEFLPSNKVNFLIAYNQLFIDLINTRKYNCSDANYITGRYEAINETHAKLVEVKSYEFFNDQKPIKIDYNVGETIKSNTCLYCNITTEIYASNINKKFSKSEVHKFVGLHTIINPLKETITHRGMTNEFYQSYIGVLKSFKICEGITNGECRTVLCNELNKHFELDIACEESKTRGGGNFPNYGTEVIDPIDSCI